jgi:hypothetical protein
MLNIMSHATFMDSINRPTIIVSKRLLMGLETHEINVLLSQTWTYSLFSFVIEENCRQLGLPQGISQSRRYNAQELGKRDTMFEGNWRYTQSPFLPHREHLYTCLEVGYFVCLAKTVKIYQLLETPRWTGGDVSDWLCPSPLNSLIENSHLP